MSKKTKDLCIIAMIAAIYTVVSLALAPFTFGNIQVRIAEALTLIPLIYFGGIYGVTLGCFLTNLIGAIMGVNLLGFMDAIIGTLATFLAAYSTYALRNKTVKNIPVLAILMPVIFNGIIIGLELAYVLFPDTFLTGALICGIEVAIGEFISVILGYFLIKALGKTKIFN